MFNIKIILVAAVAIFSIGCTSMYDAKVDFDQNPDVVTAQYKTFAWLKTDKMLTLNQKINPVMKLRVDDAIENAFIAQGYTLITTPEKADFAISYTIGSRDKIKVNSYPTSYNNTFGWGRGYYGHRGYYGGVSMGTETRVKNYTEGKLAIDVYDVKLRQPAWHGWAIKRISSDDREDPEELIETLIQEVVANFY